MMGLNISPYKPNTPLLVALKNHANQCQNANNAREKKRQKQ
jgi:hypothetical protein